MDRRSLPLAVGLVVCAVIAAGAWVRVKLHAPTLVDVRGSAKKRITSDFAEWTANVSADKKDRVEAYRALNHHRPSEVRSKELTSSLDAGSRGTYHWYLSGGEAVKTKRAKVFWTGRSQAVRLPMEFRFDSDSVLVRREGAAVILEPADDWPDGYVESFAGVPSDLVRPGQGDLDEREDLG
jgi:antitoxin VapB